MTITTELGQSVLTLTQPASGASASGGSLANFETAMRKALASQDEVAPAGFEPVQLAQTGPLTDVPQAGAISPVGAAEFDPLNAPVAPQRIEGATAADTRAASGLGVVGAAEGAPGQTILSGLERLRGAFDGKIGSVGARMENTEMSVQAMVSLQAEVVEYSVLVDVSSKLAGKSTQAMDSLMKGQ
ncbi:hypothetical protein [Celeribacter sp.]|uniref:hypothetical protein n=1 Tax=Celeribacter sp. TaxID=1890673 RepID=UPI003A8CBD3A